MVIREIDVLDKAKPVIISSEAGRQIDSNDEQPESTVSPISLSFDPDSNVNDKRNLQSEKQ
jgi:hypothetical protein